MTPRRRWLPLLIRLFFGTIAGHIVTALAALPVLYLLKLFEVNGGPLAWGMVALLCFEWIWIIVLYIRPELKPQQAAYRIAIGRYEQFNYSIREVGASSGRCPECGKRFKRP
jgi:hypothetical protein